MPEQLLAWTCSANALAWIERSTGVNSSATGASAVAEIGYPANINETYGLMDGSGFQLARVLEDYYELPTHLEYLTFDSVYALAGQTTGCLGGQAWYHWVAIRGQYGSDIWIANSAPGYKGVYDRLSRDQFNYLGPFAGVYLA